MEWDEALEPIMTNYARLAGGPGVRESRHFPPGSTAFRRQSGAR